MNQHKSRRDTFQIDGDKTRYHLDRITQLRLNPHTTFPIYIEISPVGHCNHRCTFCAVDYIGYKVRRIETNVLINNISDMARNGVKSIMFAGEGEPLLHPDIDTIVNHTKKHGIDVAFTTNGTALTKKFVDSALANIDWIKVSCNAGDPRTYANIHQCKETDYSKVWDNLRYAVSVRDRCALNTVIGIQCVLLPENAHSIEQLVKMAKLSKLDYCVIKPYSQHNSSITTQYKDIHYTSYIDKITQLEQYTDDTFEVVTRTNAMSSWDNPERGYHKCLSTPYLWAYIMANGDVYGCSAYLLDDRFNYGNINTQLFSNIWLGDKRKTSMEYVAHKLDITECRKNCRMDKVNKFLWDIANPGQHTNFI